MPRAPRFFMVVLRRTLRWYRLPNPPRRSLSAPVPGDDPARRAQTARQARLLDFDILLY